MHCCNRLSSAFSRHLVVLACALVVLPLAAGGQDSAPLRIKSVRIGHGAARQGWVKLASWNPVWIDLEAGSAPFEGRVELTVLDDDGTPSIVRVPVAAARPGGVTLTAYVKPGASGGQVEAVLRGAQNRAAGRPVTAVPSRTLSWSTQVVHSLGRASGLEELASLPKFLGASTADTALVVAPLSQMTDDARGLDSADVIVLAPEDASTVGTLGTAGARVLRDWVERGGHLVVSLGREGEATAAALGDLLPAKLAGTLQLSDVGPIENFAGNVTRPLRGPISVARLLAIEAQQPVTLAATSATPLVLRSAHGFGRVTVTGVDVSGRPFSDWGDRRYFWDKLVGLRGHSTDVSTSFGGTRGALIQSASSDLAARMHQSQQAFPHVTLIPFGWVASLVAVYLLLIGPIDYFFLRRVVGRMELTWITFPLIVLATSLVAYGVARAFKGNTLMANKLDLLDVDQGGGLFRGASWMTLYSPGNHDYAVTLIPVGAVLPASDTRRSGEETATSLSWFAPPDTGLAGLGRMALGNRSYTYDSWPGGARLETLRIPIWSSKSLAGEWAGRGEGLRLLDTDLRVVAGDRLAGVVRNMLSVPLQNAQLYYGKHVYELGNLRPGGIARVDSQRSEAMARVLGSTIQRAERARAATGGGGSDASAAGRGAAIDFLRGALFHDALGTRAEDYPSQPLRRIDLTGQVVELRRPMLVAEVDAPAAQLTVEGGPGKASTMQSTLLRVILPMDQRPAAPPAAATLARPDENNPGG
jgi:hypothetical protein